MPVRPHKAVLPGDKGKARQDQATGERRGIAPPGPQAQSHQQQQGDRGAGADEEQRQGLVQPHGQVIAVGVVCHAVQVGDEIEGILPGQQQEGDERRAIDGDDPGQPAKIAQQQRLQAEHPKGGGNHHGLRALEERQQGQIGGDRAAGQKR